MTSAEFRAIRQALGLNQTELEAKLGMTQPMVSRIERGDREPTRQQGAAILLLRELLTKGGMKMRRAEDEAKGIMAVALDDGDENILRFGRMKYDAALRLFRTDCGLNLCDFAVYPTKAMAVAAAKVLRFPAHHVERVGSRFWAGWGIRHDARDLYFLATV